MLIVPFLLLAGCDEKTTVEENPPVVEQVITQPEKLTPEQELEKLQKEAEENDISAQLKLGLIYLNGGGVEKNIVKGLDLLEKSANSGNAEAQLKLAKIYLKGIEENGLMKIPENISKAVEFYRAAAEQGVSEAQFFLAEMYYKADGIYKIDELAFKWYEKSASQGHIESQFRLGWMYKHGEGIEKNLVSAAKWYQKASDQGDDEATTILGTMYYSGEGVPKDAVKSIELFQKAAVKGFSMAQIRLAVACYQGEVVYKDKISAYAWANLAAARGDEYAPRFRGIIEKELTKAEIIEAQKLSANWKLGDNLLTSNNNNSSNIVQTNHQPTQQKYGTAIIVSKDGHALTNHHVVNGCNEIKIAGRDGVAKLITSDSANDIALLQLPNNNDNFAKINPEPNKLRQGEDVIVFGYPLNSVLSSGGNLTFGTVSALSGLGNNTNQIQITAPIQPGSSGSPVMDKKGDIVGIVSMKLDDTKMAKATGQIGQTINFAVNGQTVKTFLDTNNVPYKTGGGFFSMEKNNADIAEEAKKWTVLVECWK